MPVRMHPRLSGAGAFVGLLAGGAAVIVAPRRRRLPRLLGHGEPRQGGRLAGSLDGGAGPRRRADQALNRQTARLNVASTRLRAARRAIARSEQDVKELAARQREFANEKAHCRTTQATLEREQEALIEQQNALVGVANQSTFCRNGLVDLVNTFTQRVHPTLEQFESAVSQCQAADSDIDSYIESYGGQSSEPSWHWSRRSHWRRGAGAWRPNRRRSPLSNFRLLSRPMRRPPMT